MDDRLHIFQWLAESDITYKMLGPPYFEDNPPPTWNEFIQDYNPEFFNDEDPDHGRSYIIEVDGGPVGHINYNEIYRPSNYVEMDIWLAGSAYCNKGYGSDAICTLCDYLRDNLACSTFVIAPSARNQGAIRVYEKCGFRITSEVFEGFIPDYFDTVVMVKTTEIELFEKQSFYRS